MIIADVDLEKLAKTPPMDFGGPIVGTVQRFTPNNLINLPQTLIGVEDFLPGSTVDWVFWHDEVQYILQGEADVTYTLVPNHDKVNTVHIGPGKVYIILNGTRATFKVTSKEPYTHLCVISPRYHYDRWLLKKEFEGVSLAEYRQRMGQAV
ncbi:MAG: hypothetical protein HYX96_08275 [Chloroflexi bacterium]|nr:hypothetical protein [Chloroflexota bacterium]